MAATSIMMNSMKGEKSRRGGSGRDVLTDLQGDSLALIQAVARGRYQRRLTIKQKRELKSARGEGRLSGGDDSHLYDEFGNKKGMAHLMAEYAPNASSAKIHMMALSQRYDSSPSGDPSTSLSDPLEMIEPVNGTDPSPLKKKKMNEARSRSMYDGAMKRSSEVKVKQSLSVVRGEVHEQVKHFRDLMRADDWLLLPDSKHMQSWDKVTMTALFFTAVVTPYEVSFLETDRFSFLFWVNQVVNMVFIIDLFMQFFIPYKLSKAKGGHWIKGKNDIAVRYLQSWFTIDILSILPFDELATIDNSSSEESPFASLLKMVKIIRLLRLLKLFRVLRASRVYKRWEARVAIPYAYIALIKFSILLLIMGHWMACVGF